MYLSIFGQGYKQPRSLNLDAQTRVNFYFQSDQEGKFPLAAFPRPGLTLFSPGTTGQKSVRQLFAINDLCFAVIDNQFYVINENGGRSSKGYLKTFSGYVDMKVNGYQCLISDGFLGYIYQYRDVIDGNPTDIWTVVNDPDFIAPKIINYQQGYGIYTIDGSQKVQLTKLNDFSNIAALDFNSASGWPDWATGTISSHQELWVFNNQTTEVWYNTGDPNTPFQPRQTLLLQYGCLYPTTIKRLDNSTLMWLTANEHGENLVVKAQGYVPKIVSIAPVSDFIASYDKTDVFAFAFQEGAHIFYALTFPKADNTWIYDIATDAWFEWKSTITSVLPASSATHQGRWRPNCYCNFAEKHLVGDFDSGNIYYLDWDNYTDNGVVIERELTTRHFQKELKRVTFNEVQYSFEEGVGLPVNQGVNPQVMLQFSKDNGHSWSNEKWRSVGKVGQYAYRARWLKLGDARDWVFRIRMSDPVKWVIVGINAEMEVES